MDLFLFSPEFPQESFRIPNKSYPYSNIYSIYIGKAINKSHLSCLLLISERVRISEFYFSRVFRKMVVMTKHSDPNPGWCSKHNCSISDDQWRNYLRWISSPYVVQYLRTSCALGCSTEEDKLTDETLALMEKQITELTRPVKVEKECSGRWYLITFTQPDTVDSPIDLLKRSRKVINSKQVSPTMWAMALELTEKGTPHTHIRLFSEKYFDYKKICNFNGGYRAEVAAEKHTSESYVVKAESKPSKEWLDKYKLDSCFWSSDNYSGKLFSPPVISGCPVVMPLAVN